MEPQRIIFWHKTHKTLASETNTHKNVVKAKVNVVFRFNLAEIEIHVMPNPNHLTSFPIINHAPEMARTADNN